MDKHEYTNKIFDEYFRQEGLNFSWHTVWNKIYSISLWKKARKHYNKIDKHLRRKHYDISRRIQKRRNFRI